MADSNPPSTILWRKEGLNGIFSPDDEINFSPVSRHTAGLYSCTAENALGMSKPAFVELDVKCESLVFFVSLLFFPRFVFPPPCLFLALMTLVSTTSLDRDLSCLLQTRHPSCLWVPPARSPLR